MQFNFARFIYCMYDRNFALHYSERLELICVLGTDRSYVLIKREGKSALYGVICCCDNRLLSRAVVCGHTV